MVCIVLIGLQDFPYQEQYDLVLEHLRILAAQEHGEGDGSAGPDLGNHGGVVEMENDVEWSDGED